jgi:phenylacetic acid degradation operon negative regulatory protein
MADLARSRALVAGYRDRPDASTRRLIVTVFGDTIEPRGGSIWLQALIDLLAGLDINERLVRTSVQRLVSEGVLHNERIGRRSRYSLTDAARLDARDAEQRIYHGIETAWDGRWTMVVATGQTVVLPPDLDQRLGWRGFGRLRPEVFASPVVDPDGARRLLTELGVTDGLAVLSAVTETDDRALAQACFDLSAVQDGYTSFVETYSMISEEMCGDAAPDELAFAVRTLLIDDYRRVLLRDPELPAPLLPDEWAGAVARAVAADVYRAVSTAADRHVSATCATADEPYPPPSPRAGLRFRSAGGRDSRLSDRRRR